MNLKRYIFCVVFFSVFITGTYTLSTIPTSVCISSNILVPINNDDFIYIDIITPKEQLYQEKNGYLEKKAIIICHDSWHNKETMRDLAIELASAGFIAICMDLRGLGRSSFPKDIFSWISDISIVKEYLLKERADIDSNNFGFIGYGLGGNIGYSYIKEDLDFKTFIGMAMGLSYFPNDVIDVNSRFLNLLIIHPKFDQTNYLIDIKSGMAARLNVRNPDIDVNKLYGTFDKGTASMIYLDDDSTHLTGVWDSDFIRTARIWISNSFPEIKAINDISHLKIRVIILILELIGGMGFFFSIITHLSNLINKKNQKEVNQISLHRLTFKGIPTRILTYTVVFSFPGIVIFTPIILFLPLAITGFILTLFLGQIFGLSILLWRIGKRKGMSLFELFKTPFQVSNKKIISQVILGIFLFSILYLILNFSIGITYFGFIPSIKKLIYYPIYFMIGFCIFLVYDILFRLIMHSRFKFSQKNLIKTALISFGYQSFFYFTYTLSFSVHLGRYYIFGTYFPIGIPIIFLTSFISAICYQKTGNVLTGVVMNSLFLVTFLSTISLPQNGMLFIWDYTRRVIANYLAIPP